MHSNLTLEKKNSTPETLPSSPDMTFGQLMLDENTEQ